MAPHGPSVCVVVVPAGAQGGFAEVHKARHRVTGDLAAVKVVYLSRPGLSSDQVGGKLTGWQQQDPSLHWHARHKASARSPP